MTENKPLQNWKSPLLTLIRFVLICISCFLVFNIIGAYVAAYLLGVSATSLDIAHLAEKENIWVLKLMQIIVSAGSFLLPPLIYVYLQKKPFLAEFGLKKKVNYKLVLSSLVIVFLAGPFIYWLLQINQGMILPDFLKDLELNLQNMEEENTSILIHLLNMENVYQLLFNLFMVAVLPGIGEELLFRGVLQRLLGKAYNNPHLGIIGAAMVFSFIHFQFYGFLPRMAMGMLFGYLYFWSGNLLYPIIGHIAHNAAQVFMVYSLGADFSEQDLDKVGQYPPLMIMVATVFLLISLMRFQNMTKSKSADAK